MRSNHGKEVKISRLYHCLYLQEEDHLNLHQTMGWTLQIVNSTMVLMDMEVDPQPLEESPKRQLHPFPTFLTFSVGKPRKVLV